MDIYEAVIKLVGNIKPVGETYEDDRRFENLKVLTRLVDDLLTDIDDVATTYKGCPEYSKQRASKFASDFYNQIGIKD